MYWNAVIGVILGIITMFNNNIRCIEIRVPALLILDWFLFNNNIRCIEIFVVKPRPDNRLGLITT